MLGASFETHKATNPCGENKCCQWQTNAGSASINTETDKYGLCVDVDSNNPVSCEFYLYLVIVLSDSLTFAILHGSSENHSIGESIYACSLHSGVVPLYEFQMTMQLVLVLVLHN